MIVLLKQDASLEQSKQIKEKIASLGFHAHEIPGMQKMVIGITGSKEQLDRDLFLSMPGVQDVVLVSKPFKLVSREVKTEDSLIRVGEKTIGGNELVVIAGPCSVESREQIIELADILSSKGIRFLRGGAFKPRSSPYSFQGLKEEGLKYLREAADRFGMYIVTEVKDSETLPLVTHYADVLQVGSRNMYNFSLLEKLGGVKRAILLKRGLSATIEELLMSAEYIASSGNYNIILCERGIRSFEPYTRNTLDLNAVPLLKQLTHLPVIVDPSHGTGAWNLVPPMSKAAIAAGADGLLIEVHQNPQAALSDGFQSLKPETFFGLLDQLEKLAPFVGRSLLISSNTNKK
ncbi:MAG: 3-deoxy-7-phosphoheptulonate synthase [bacterium]